jgi:hypothetical protein
MAPEVLDGAVSFTRDNFQRIDICTLVDSSFGNLRPGVVLSR